MITKKQFTLLFCVFLFAVLAFQAQPVEALPFDNEYTDQSISPGAYLYDTFILIAGEEISGYFETVSDAQGLDFFICDAANFTDWDLGYAATGFEVASNMHTYWFSFTAPYTDTWYVVFDNTGGSLYITFDAFIDEGVDNTPSYSSYDHSGYGEVLEDDEYLTVSLTLGAGAVIDGHFSTFFTTDGLDFFICDADNYADWIAGYSATGYSIETDMHVASIDAYTIPTAGTWYCVFVAQDEIDAVTFSYGIDVDTSGVVTTTTTGGAALEGSITAIGLVAAVLILGILCCVCRSKKKEPELTPPPVDHYRAPSQPATTETVREREIVRDRVLVICPYCGAKNDQGVLRCHSCNAEL